jgi:hypothetical protein
MSAVASLGKTANSLRRNRGNDFFSNTGDWLLVSFARQPIFDV